MRRFTVIALACLVGCVSTPGELRSSTEPHVFESRTPPPTAAACIGRAAEESLGAGKAIWREGAKAGTWEVMSVAFVADLTPTPTGSRTEVRFDSAVLPPWHNRTILEAMKGC